MFINQKKKGKKVSNPDTTYPKVSALIKERLLAKGIAKNHTAYVAKELGLTTYVARAMVAHGIVTSDRLKNLAQLLGIPQSYILAKRHNLKAIHPLTDVLQTIRNLDPTLTTLTFQDFVRILLEAQKE